LVLFLGRTFFSFRSRLTLLRLGAMVQTPANSAQTISFAFFLVCPPIEFLPTLVPLCLCFLARAVAQVAPPSSLFFSFVMRRIHVGPLFPLFSMNIVFLSLHSFPVISFLPFPRPRVFWGETISLVHFALSYPKFL